MLFDDNQQVLQDAKEWLESDSAAPHETLERFRQMTAEYEKLLQDSSRLLRFSDKMEKQLHNLKRDLEKKVQEGIRRYKEQEDILAYQSKMAAIGEMVAAISHQWKQPLTVLGLLTMNLTDSYQRDELTPEFIASYADEQRRQLEFMNHTINDFKNFFQPEKACELKDIHGTLKQAISLLSAILATNSVEASIEGDPVSAWIPHNELCHVIVNLVKNACEAHGPKWREGKWIRIRTKEEDGVCVLRVEDNAGGIDPKVLDEIFEPYVTTKGDEGTGIGLYMSRVIVLESLQGEIWADNTEEGGVCFTIRFPLHLSASAKQADA